MSKRKPTSELNDRNWDQEEEAEEAGSFSLAGQDVLKNRVIRKAKRTMPSGEKRISGSVFAGFALKSSDSSDPKPSLSTGVTLNFGSNLTFQPKTNGTKQLGSSSSAGDPCQKDPATEDNPEYLRQLKVLNENILSWIQKHVNENPYCILTPSFKDYEKHLGVLEKKYSVQSSNTTAQNKTKAEAPVSSVEKKEGPAFSLGAASSSASRAEAPTFGFGVTTSTESKTEKKEGAAPSFSFGVTSASAGNSAEKKDAPSFSFGVTSASAGSSAEKKDAPSFSFGVTSASAGSSAENKDAPTFSFVGTGAESKGPSSSIFGAASSSSKPFAGGFSFGQSVVAPSQSGQSLGAASDKPASSQQQSTENEDEEYQPPKPEVREIKEQGAVYTKRCKLFYQKAGQWVDRGVGNLHLKLTDDGRTQLIIRADTNLGNILLNVFLSSAMPTKRQGKNNVLFTCVPNPPIDPARPSTDPMPMLLRVKTGEEADEMLARLEEMKA